MSAYDEHFDDREDDDPRDDVVCKYCGAEDVEWIHTGVRWRLYDNAAKKLHVCPRVATPDDFDEVKE